MPSDDRPIFRGAYFELPMLLLQRSNSDPLIITTWEFAANFQANDSGTTDLATSTALGHWIASSEDEGRVRFVLTPEITLALPLGRIYADVFRTDSSVGKQRLMSLTIPVRDPT